MAKFRSPARLYVSSLPSKFRKAMITSSGIRFLSFLDISLLPERILFLVHFFLYRVGVFATIRNLAVEKTATFAFVFELVGGLIDDVAKAQSFQKPESSVLQNVFRQPPVFDCDLDLLFLIFGRTTAECRRTIAGFDKSGVGHMNIVYYGV